MFKVWRGALLAADFVANAASLFEGAIVLELGAGAGLSGIALAAFAKPRVVFLTDVGAEILKNCRANVCLNRHTICPDASLKVSQKP